MPSYEAPPPALFTALTTGPLARIMGQYLRFADGDEILGVNYVAMPARHVAGLPYPPYPVPGVHYPPHLYSPHVHMLPPPPSKGKSKKRKHAEDADVGRAAASAPGPGDAAVVSPGVQAQQAHLAFVRCATGCRLFVQRCVLVVVVVVCRWMKSLAGSAGRA